MLPRAFIIAAGLLCSAISVAAGPDYDAHLCATAQRLLINADASFPVAAQRGTSNGFHTIQMSIDTARRGAVIAMSTHTAEYAGAPQPTYVECKMVDRERVNAVLGLALPGPDRQCRDVNAATLQTALSGLTAAQRERYFSAGRQLQLGDDVILGSGGEWLPVTLDDYVQPAANNTVAVRAPSVRVPWNPAEQNFFQGVQHCKLISLAAMQRWVTQAAFTPDATLIPATNRVCTAPTSLTSTVGSCLFYFAPADTLYCQDYSGAEWTPAAAQQECAARHASRQALTAAKNRYEGAGGVFATAACADRTDAPAIAGSCVFHCNAGDETLWHIGGAVDPRMTQGCDLFIDR